MKSQLHALEAIAVLATDHRNTLALLSRLAISPPHTLRNYITGGLDLSATGEALRPAEWPQNRQRRASQQKTSSVARAKSRQRPRYAFLSMINLNTSMLTVC